MAHHARTDVLPIQTIVANASPGAWLDGVVSAREQDALTVVLLDGGVRVLSTSATPEIGEPVAVHPVAEVIGVGSAWYSARALGDRDGAARS